MIKKWGNFINESISEEYLNDIKNQISNFIGQEGITKIVGSTKFDDIFKMLTQYRSKKYNKASLKISNFYQKGDWNKLFRGSYGEKVDSISKVINLCLLIKDEFNEEGKLLESVLLKNVKLIVHSTIDDFEIEEIVETGNGIIITISIKSKIDIKILSSITDDLNTLCMRLKDDEDLENQYISFRDEDHEKVDRVELLFTLPNSTY